MTRLETQIARLPLIRVPLVRPQASLGPASSDALLLTGILTTHLCGIRTSGRKALRLHISKWKTATSGGFIIFHIRCTILSPHPP